MNQRPNKEETIFHAALELQPQKRADYLALACAGDDALSHRIKVLLEAGSEADPFFRKEPMVVALAGDPEGSPSQAAAAGQPAEDATIALNEKVGERIGRYKLLQQIGEGGCGVV